MKAMRLVLFLGCFATVLTCSAQQFGGNPPSLKWLQLNFDTARIIFPQGLELQARQVAAIVAALGKATVSTAGGRLHKIDIIFQNQTTISNGYVALAPFRSEFELTADQNSFELGSLPWQQQLVIHEYRHVQQYSNYRIGLSKVMYYLFGEGGQELANNLSVPNWFWEGDAVYQETLVSRQGRGRLPFFFNGYRSLWAADKHYSYLKLRNGSLRDYTPDHYPLGYMMVAYGRERYDDHFWEKVTTDAASFTDLFYPLQKGIRRYAGVSFNEFRDSAFKFFSDQQSFRDPLDSVARFAKEHKHFVGDEEFPQWINSNEILYMRSTYKQIPAFVIKNVQTDEVRLVKTRSVSLDNYFSYANNRIVYAAYETDPRWGWRDYNVIHLLDIQSGVDRRVTHRSKYFSPDVSADGKRIVAVDVDVQGRTTLHLINASGGQTEKIIPNPKQRFYTYPKFYADGRIISAIRNEKGEMSLANINIADGQEELLMPFSMQVIGYPSVSNDTIYFGAVRDGMDGSFAVAHGQLFELTLPNGNRSTGNYALHESNGKYAWTAFSATGYKMFYSSGTALAFHDIPKEIWVKALDEQHVDALRRGPADLLDSIAFSDRIATKYGQSFRLFNFHSWRPYITDPDYSFSVVSENVLSTLQSDLFVDYNRNEHYVQFGADATYAQLFPWIDGGANYTFNRNALHNGQTVYWNEAQANLGLSVPLHITRGTSYTNIQFGSDMVYSQRYFQGSFKDSFSTKGFAYSKSFLNFSIQSQQARQQIYPRLAAAASVSYSRAVTTVEGNQFLASGSLYLPGFNYTHNLVLTGAFQQRDSLQQVSFSNSFPFSRGYSAENFYRMIRFGGNYHFPVAYPDWGFGSIVYFLRIRANAFYDYTKVLDFFRNGSKFQPEYRSVGMEVYFDSQWWNQLPVSFGIRYSRLLDADFEGRGPNQWEFILPINLLSR